MLDALKPLLESDLVNEETREEIQEAWEAKINEVKEQTKSELREEFAQRYEHDKTVMVEALDNMVTESLQDELKQIVIEKKALAEDRVKFNTKMTEAAERFDTFLVSKLAEEIKELRKDRAIQSEATAKLEDFMVKALAEEIEDFQQDKKQVVETKVRLVREAKTKMADLQKAFIKRSAKLVESTMTKRLTKELTALKEDINASRENDFGRRIFESFASEFSHSHLNTNVEIKKLEKIVKEQASKLNEATHKVQKATRIVESKNTQLRAVEDRIKRENVMNELLKPLNKEKSSAMKELLESIETSRLKTAFEKYLPALLNETKKKPHRRLDKRVINESKEVTGNKKEQPAGDLIELNVIKALAGI